MASSLPLTIKRTCKKGWERLKYKDNGYNADGQQRDVVTMCGGRGMVKRTNMPVINHLLRLLTKKSYKKLKNGPRNLECVKKNAKLTSTNP